MRCYRLEANGIREGIPASRFPVANAVVTKGLVLEAAVSLIIPKEVDGDLFRQALKDYGGVCHQFGEAWLRCPRNSQAVKELLVAFDWKEYRPDPNLGDDSVLISWRGTYALYRCRPNSTFLRSRGGVLVTNDGGQLQKVLPEAYERFRAEHLRKQTSQAARKSAVLDYIVE